MPHPIYGPPQHSLHHVTLRLGVPTRTNGRTTSVEILGWAETSRKALWSIRESWLPSDVESGLQPADACHHALLVALQDYPTTQHQFERGLLGEGWEQLELPL